jgi:hypothetical protein
MRAGLRWPAIDLSAGKKDARAGDPAPNGSSAGRRGGRPHVILENT